jgi:replicative DNA helicase
VTAEQVQSPWEMAADDVLSVMLNDESGRNRILYEYGVKPAHMPTAQHRLTFEAITDCMRANDPINDVSIIERTGPAVNVVWLATVKLLFDDMRLIAIPYSAKRLIEHGTNAGVRRILKMADEELAKGKSHDNVTPRLMTALTAINTAKEVTGETADVNAADFMDFMDSEPPSLPLTGLPWLDALTGGVNRGHMWWIAAPYKSRKSTVMLNIALGLMMTWFTRGCAGEPPSISIASGEMTRRRVIAQLVAMMAVAYVRRRNWWQERFTAGSTSYPLHMISADSLMKAQKNYRQWDTRRVEAVDYGVRQYAQFSKALRIYDSQTGGGLGSFEALMTTMRRDIHLYKTNVFFVDYLQLFAPGGMKLFEFMSGASLQLQRFAQANNVTVIGLVQQNEETIRSGSSYSAGVKGGGDAAATADYLITSLYRAGDFVDDDTKLQLTMKLSRHSTGGGDTQHVHDIHPASGLLLASDWIGRL